jgi:hypothetical protein
MVQAILPAIGKQEKYVVCDVNSPPSNTGVPRTQVNVRPDNLWLVCSRDHRPDLKGLNGEQTVAESAKKWKDFSRKLFRLFSDHFSGSGIILTTIPERGKNFYDKGFYLRRGQKELASICYDGKQQNGTFLIILTGQFCSLLDHRQYRLIHRLCTCFDIKMRRFDLAVDDYVGKVFDLLEIERLGKMKKGWFKPVYRPKGFDPHCRRVEGEDDSYSIYVGGKESMIQVCAYEKGKESKHTQRARDFPRWIRYEVRWKAKKGILDLAMLLPENWMSSAAGTSIYLQSKMKVVGDKFTMMNEIKKEVVEDAFVTAYMANERQYGIFNAECDRLGLEVPRRASASYVTPYASLTIYDKEELLERIDSARLGRLRSIAQADESTEEVLF